MNDLTMLGISFRLAYFVRFEASLPVFRLDVVPSIPFYQNVILVLIPIWLGIFILDGLYHRPNLLGGTKEYSLVFQAVTIGILMVIVAGFIGPDFVIARGWLLLAWMFAFILTSAGRFLLRRVVYWLRQFGFFMSSALIVGGNDEARLLAEQLLSWQTSGLHLVGFVDDENPEGALLYGRVPVLGRIDQLDQLIALYKVDELILATSAIHRETMLKVFKRYGLSNGVNVRLSSGMYEIITTGLQVTEFASVPLVRVNKVRLTGSDEVLKTLLDYGLTIPGLILISPLLLVIALIIKLDSPGPVIHRRKVMGVNGRQFYAFKFRTMYVNGDEILRQHPELQNELAEFHKLKEDPRITRVGKYLRKFSLDELPQLFNVLMHEMSLVGPRMISPEEMVKYNQWGINLLTVRPGLTGLWQVSGRSDIGYDQRVRLDMYYIRNWTVWMDLGLLAWTLPAAIAGKGAY
ncbi:MAG TPA: sugar transferase [Anaerolineaceae bacterium]|nr:sugar transferase [Anaerolineaceae bacterium]